MEGRDGMLSATLGWIWCHGKCGWILLCLPSCDSPSRWTKPDNLSSASARDGGKEADLLANGIVICAMSAWLRSPPPGLDIAPDLGLSSTLDVRAPDTGQKRTFFS